jgi:hypothetical protein
VTGGKSITISSVSAVIPLVTFYNINGRKKEVLSLFPGNHARILNILKIIQFS